MKKEIKIAYFPSNTPRDTVLTKNGNVLDNWCTKAETEENIETGNYTLDATFTLDALDYMECENILKVKMDYGDEVFKISKVTIGTRYVDIVARQITIPATLCLYLDDVRPTNQNGQGALSHLLTNAEGVKEITLVSDIETIGTAYYEDMSLYKAIHDSDNSFINRWGGEVLRRGYTLSILQTVGIDRGVSIREGKNLTGFNGSSNLDNLITKARGKGFNGIKGNWVNSPLINSYAGIYQQTIDYQDVKVKGDNDTEGYDTLALAQAELDRRVNLEYSQNDIDKIKATYDINFVQLEKTEEYKNYALAERTYIGDIIRVYVPKVKCDVKVRAIIKKYDVLGQKTKEIKVSNAIVTQAMSTNSIINDLKKQYSGTNNNGISAYIDSIIKSGLKNSFVIMRENELLAMDTKDINTATNVVRLNNKGLAFSQTGYYGTYNYGFTIDGVINASLISTGILTAILIQSKDGGCSINLDTGAIEFNKGIIRGLNSSWNLDTGILSFSGNNLNQQTKMQIMNGWIFNQQVFSIMNKVEGVTNDSQFLMSHNNSGNGAIYMSADMVNLAALSDYGISFMGNTDVTGDFAVTGTKNCIQSTTNYGDRLFYSVEDTDSYLTNRVPKTITTGPSTEIKIDIDSIYKECVNTEIDYIVEINKLSFGDYRIKEQTKDYFIIEADRTGFQFKYTIVAKRKGYENRHLDEYIREVK